MRFIYMDEAGTESKAPVTVVVGVCIDADKQLLRAEAAIDDVLKSVPSSLRKDFIFSAKDVFSNDEYWAHWGRPDRLALLRQMMLLPRRLKAAISLSIVRRGKLEYWPQKMRPNQLDHFWAFVHCVAAADRHIRNNADVDEIGTIVAEQASEMTEFLREGARIYRDGDGLILPPKSTILTKKEKELGYPIQETDIRVSRIRPAIHFVNKGEEKLVFLADACAFGFRRFFAGEEFGDEFVQHILGQPIHMPDWEGANSFATFRFE